MFFSSKFEIFGFIQGPHDEQFVASILNLPLNTVLYRKEVLFGQVLLASAVAQSRIQQQTHMSDVIGGSNWLVSWNYTSKLEELLNLTELTEKMKEQIFLHAIFIAKVSVKFMSPILANHLVDSFIVDQIVW